eukprot:GGOE01046037.1.p1 GENE.GGOE01046037.1~~GGOE01046037.1.p1  ORF type:complete len:256 (+),score=28.42 GGOE01046037.1:159-926(+)
MPGVVHHPRTSPTVNRIKVVHRGNSVHTSQPAHKKPKLSSADLEPPPLVAATPPTEPGVGSTTQKLCTSLELHRLQTVDMKIVTEIYDWNFHMQPRVLQGILTKGYFASETFVLKQIRTVLCVATLKTHQLPSSTFLEIILCATNIYFRNCGAASLLVALVIEKARRTKCDHVIAWAAKPAQSFWLKRGFRLRDPSVNEIAYFRRSSLVFDNTFPMMLDVSPHDPPQVRKVLRQCGVTLLRDSLNDVTWQEDPVG